MLLKKNFSNFALSQPLKFLSNHIILKCGELAMLMGFLNSWNQQKKNKKVQIMKLAHITKSLLVSSLSFLKKSELMILRSVSHYFEKLAFLTLSENLLQHQKYKIISVNSGVNHSIILAEDLLGKQHIFSFGSNQNGQLGLGRNIDMLTPQEIDMSFLSGSKVLNIYCPFNHVFIHAKSKGGAHKLYSWGENDYGQLGLGHTRDVNEHARSKDNHDKLLCWGSNISGQLGLGHSLDVNMPQLIDMNFLNGRKIKQIYTGVDYALLYSTSINHTGGELFGWGGNLFGQLGLGHNQDRHSPTLVNLSSLNDDEINSIHFGPYFTFIMSNSKHGQTRLFGWGANKYRQLGMNHNNNINQPALLNTLTQTSIESFNVETSYFHNIFKFENTSGKSVLYSLGDNTFGQLGLGHTLNVNMPQYLTTGPLSLIKKTFYKHNTRKSFTDRKSKYFLLGEKSASSKLTYCLSFFNVCGKKANEDWKKGYNSRINSISKNSKAHKIKKTLQNNI